MDRYVTKFRADLEVLYNEGNQIDEDSLLNTDVKARRGLLPNADEVKTIDINVSRIAAIITGCKDIMKKIKPIVG